MRSNLQAFGQLIELENNAIPLDWPLSAQQWVLPNDSNWTEAPTIWSRSDSEPLQNRSSSIFSPGCNTPLMGGPSSMKSQGKTKDKKHKLLSLACPFYRLNPWKYYTCQKYDLQRIKDVKQHIHRKHVKPDFYCARCYEVFSNAMSRDAHTREGACDIRGDPQFDGVTDSQKEDLKNCHKRGKEVAEQWYYMWDILFKDQSRPKSPYIGNYREEMGPLIRGFWENARSAIISNAPAHLSQDMFKQVMDIVLNHYESESAITTISTKIKQKNYTQIPRELEIVGSADTIVATEIGVPQVAPHVVMVDFNCLPADFNSVMDSAASDHVQCLPASGLEVDEAAFSFDNFNHEY